MAGYTEPLEPNRQLRRKYFPTSAPRHTIRTRTGPRCCGPGCPSGRGKSKQREGFRAKVEKRVAIPPKPVRYGYVGRRMVRL